MRSIYDFIIKPVGKRYDNEVKVGEHTLVTNSSIESFKHVNNIAEVIETPVAFATPIKKGDLIVIHHNVFRVFYDMKGIKKNSRSFLKDGLFFCSIDQIYLYKRNKTWKSFGDRCFVAPVKNKDILSSQKTADLIGIELVKVAEEKIVDSEEDISADRLKNAAATKKLCILDAFEILNRIQEEENMIADATNTSDKPAFKGFAEGRSK